MAAKQNMTLAEWTRICNRTYRGYRAARITLRKAGMIFSNAAYKKSLASGLKKSKLASLQEDIADAYVSLFNATNADREAVMDDMERIRSLMRNQKFVYFPDA